MKTIYYFLLSQILFVWDVFTYSHKKSLDRLINDKNFEKDSDCSLQNTDEKLDSYDSETKPFIKNNDPLRFKIINNKWGLFKLNKKGKKDKSTQYKQIISHNGWRFLTPIKNYGVIGYPAVKYVFSEQLSRINKLVVDWKLYLHITKRKYNVSFDFWLINNKDFIWADVKHEIMIWEDYLVAKPFGKKIADTVIDGVEYSIYTGYIDKSSENLGVDGWTYTCFLRKKQQSKKHKLGTTNIHKFLDEMKAKNILSYDSHKLYLHSIELGTEVYTSDGICYVDKFDVNVTLIDQE